MKTESQAWKIVWHDYLDVVLLIKNRAIARQRSAITIEELLEAVVSMQLMPRLERWRQQT
jgi:hypothetical protein